MYDVIRCIIVDDEVLTVEGIRELLRNYTEIKLIGVAGTIKQAETLILDELPDLIFLDIKLPDGDAFELLDRIEPYVSTDMNVIFISAYSDYQLEALRYSAFDFLVKPVSVIELNQAIRRLRDKERKKFKVRFKLLQGELKRKLKFNLRSGFVMIDPEDILYCKADGNYTNIFFGKDSREIVSINIGRLFKTLPKEMFYRINRSVIINLKNLRRVSRVNQSCELSNGIQLINLEVPIRSIRELEQMVKK